MRALACLIITATCFLLVAATASADNSRLWDYIDRTSSDLASGWNNEEGYYSDGRSNFLFSVYMLAIHSSAAISDHQGSSRRDERIEPLAKKLTSWPAFITDPRQGVSHHPHAPGFTMGMGNAVGYQHIGFDAQAMAALALAVRSGQLSEAVKGDVMRKMGLVPRGKYFNNYHVQLNQVNWPMQVWLAAAQADDNNNRAAAHQTRAQALNWVRGMNRPMKGYRSANLSPGLSLRYLPQAAVSAPANLVTSVEYANIIYGGFDAYEIMLGRGMQPLPPAHEAKMRRWAKALIQGDWTHSGWTNWDTGHGFERWQLLRYWAWSVTALVTMASSERIASGTERLRARWLLYRAMEHYDRLLRSGQTAPTRYGTPSNFAVPNEVAMARLRLAVSLTRAARLGIEEPKEAPSGWSWWDSSQKRLTFSNNNYSAAIVRPLSKISYGGLEPARLIDSRGRVLTSLANNLHQGGLLLFRGPKRLAASQGVQASDLGRLKKWRVARAGSSKPRLSGYSGPVYVSQRFSDRELVSSYRLTAGNGRAQMRIPLWGRLTERKLSGQNGRWTLKVKNSQGGAMTISIKASISLRPSWHKLGYFKQSPQTRTQLKLNFDVTRREYLQIRYRPES